MEIVTFVSIGIIVAVLFYAIMIYNNLVSLKHGVTKAWSNIDVLLKQRHDELPKLVETCKQYMKYEQETLERVMKARAAVSSAMQRGDVGGVGSAESELRLGLGNLFAVAENYPELRSSETIITAQQTYTEVEGHIAAARRFYNSAVTRLNNAIQIFPGSIIANWAKVRAMPFFELEDTAMRAPVDADDYLGSA